MHFRAESKEWLKYLGENPCWLLGPDAYLHGALSNVMVPSGIS